MTPEKRAALIKARFEGQEAEITEAIEGGGTMVTLSGDQTPMRSVFPIEIREENDDETIELSFSSEERVRSRWGDEEILVHESKAADFTRLKDVGSILRNHDPNQIVGVPVSVSLDTQSRKGRLVMRFGTTEEAQRARKEVVVDKTLRGVSVGFTVREWVWLKDDTESWKRFVGPAWVAARWDALEVSLTPIPADPSVGVNRCVSFDTAKEKVTMTEEEKRAAAEEAKRVADGVEAKRAADEEAERLRNATPAPEGAQEPGMSPEQVAQTARDAVAAERQRAGSIRSMCSQFQTDDKAEDLISTGKTVEEARSIVMDLLAERQAPMGDSVQVIQDGRVSHARAAGEALSIRMGHMTRDKAENGGGELANMTLLRLAEDCMVRSNTPGYHRGMDTRALVELAMRGPLINSDSIAQFNRGETIAGSTSDFPYLLAAGANKSLLDAYRAAQTTYEQWCKIGSLNDFKSTHRIKMSESGDLELIPENGTYPAGAMSESKESIQLATYGKKYSMSRQAIINDDLDGFGQQAAKHGRAAARKPNLLAVQTLLANAVMSDSAALFSTTHANYSSDANFAFDTLAHAEAGLENAIKLFRSQTAKMSALEDDTTAYIDISPRICLVGQTNEFVARKVLGATSSVLDNKNTGVPNAVGSIGIIPVVEPNLENSNLTGYGTLPWYLFADPMDGAVIEVAFLQGDREPYMEEINQTDADGRIWKVRIDCVAGAIDFAGAVKENAEA